MNKKNIMLSRLLKILLLTSAFLGLTAVFSSNKREVKKIIAGKKELAKTGTAFSIVDYNEESTTKWGRRVYTIRGKIEFDDKPYLLEDEEKQSAVPLGLVIVKSIQNNADFYIRIYKGSKNYHISDIKIPGKLISHDTLTDISRNGVVIVDGQPAFNSEKNIEKLSDLLMRRKENIVKHCNDVEKEYSQFTDDFNAFKKENFAVLKTADRLQYLKNFEKKLQINLQNLSKKKQFHQEIAFARQSPWNKFFVYPVEIGELEREMKVSIDKYEKITSNASILLKNRLHIHQQIIKGHYTVIHLRSTTSSQSPQRISPGYIDFRETDVTKNTKHVNQIKSPENTSADSGSITLKINTL